MTKAADTLLKTAGFLLLKILDMLGCRIFGEKVIPSHKMMDDFLAL